MGEEERGLLRDRSDVFATLVVCSPSGACGSVGGLCAVVCDAKDIEEGSAVVFEAAIGGV